MATYEVIDVSHQVAEETQFGSDKFKTVMKANEAYVTVAKCIMSETQRNEAYGKLDSQEQILAEQLDTDNSIGVQANEAYNTVLAEIGYATVT